MSSTKTNVCRSWTLWDDLNILCWFIHFLYLYTGSRLQPVRPEWADFYAPKVIDSIVKRLGYNEHQIVMSSFLCLVLLIVSGTKCFIPKVCDLSPIWQYFSVIFYSVPFTEITILFALFYRYKIEAWITDLCYRIKGEFTQDESEVKISVIDWLLLY